MSHAPFIAQMRSRMNSAHQQLIEAARDGGKLLVKDGSSCHELAAR